MIKTPKNSATEETGDAMTRRKMLSWFTALADQHKTVKGLIRFCSIDQSSFTDVLSCR